MPTLSVLIIDDDIQFGRLLKRIITSVGHRVFQISQPGDIFDQYDKVCPDIIFLDIFMPGFDGIDIARWLIEKRFNGRIIFMTGYDPCFLRVARMSLQQETDADVATLEKPARVEQLFKLINEECATDGTKSLDRATIAYQDICQVGYSAVPQRFRRRTD